MIKIIMNGCNGKMGQVISRLAAADDECETAANLISSLVLNIRYDHGKLICVTGCSFTTFIMDKSAERVWDDYIGKFLMPFSPLT